MKNILVAFVYLSIILIFASAQQIQIIPTLIFTPQINQDYSAVSEFVYTSPSKFTEALPKDYYVKKIQSLNLTPADQPLKKTQNSLFISFEDELVKQMPTANKVYNIPVIQDYNAVSHVYPQAVIPKKIEQEPVKIDFATNNQKGQNYFQMGETYTKKEVLPYVKEQTLKDNPLSDSPASKKGNNLQQQASKQQKQPKPTFEIKRPPVDNSASHPTEQDKYQSPNSGRQTSNEVKNKKQLVTEIEQLRYQHHKWIIIVVILIIVTLLTFLFGRLFNKNNEENVNKRLDHFKLATDPINEQQEQEQMTTKVADQQ